MYQPVYAPFSSLVERDMNVSAAPLNATPGPGSYAVPAGNAAAVIALSPPVVSNFRKKCILRLSREIFFACKLEDMRGNPEWYLYHFMIYFHA
jgi:hypothetical protein